VFNEKVLLIIARVVIINKGGKYYTQFLDGKYIDDIAFSFKKVKILAPILEEEEKAFKFYSEYNYSFLSRNIELIPLCMDDKLQIKGIIFNFIKIIRQYFQVKNIISKVDLVFIFMPLFRSVIGCYFAKKYKKDIVLYSGNKWDDCVEYTYRWNYGILIYFKNIYKVLCKFLEEWTMKNVHIRIVNGSNLREKYANYTGVTVQTIPLIHVPSEDYYEKRKLFLGKKIKLISVGAIIPRKNYECLIKVVKILKDKFEVSLSIIGASKDDSYKKMLMGVIESYGLEENIIFCGYISNRQELLMRYRQSDILVLASRHEGFPRVVWEAFTQDLPVITSRISEIENEFKTDKDLLLFANENEPQDFANKVENLYFNKGLQLRILDNIKSYRRRLLNKTPSDQFLLLLSGSYNLR